MKAVHENNFWELYPELIIIDELYQIYHKDKSKKKEDSSKIMWAIYFAFHPESKFINLPNKLDVLAKDYLKDPKFNWDNIKKQIEIYKNLVLSDAERALINWGEIMNMRDSSIKELYTNALQNGDIDELVKIDKMLANTPKMFDDYKKVKKDYEEEKVTKRGKKINSLSDDDEI